MVDANRIKRKLPSLLINGETTIKKNWNDHNRVVYHIQQFKKRNPQKFNTLVNKLITVLEEFEKAVFAN